MNKLLFWALFTAMATVAQPKAPEVLPKPFATKSASNFSKVVGWKNNRKPTAPEGFVVEKYVDGLDNPRWMLVLPNGDILVAQSNSNYSILKQIGARIIGAGRSKNLKRSADVITLLRDADKDGRPELKTKFLDHGLNQPFGMLLLDNWLYVANTDAVVRFRYERGQEKITGRAEKLVDLPAGKPNQHWTRNIIANPDKSKIYIAIGSASNIAEKGIDKETLRACILEMNPDGFGLKVFASGLRNPVGMGWAPGTKTLWTTVNERDKLGDELVPDYLTSVREDGFYGWPYAYFGKNIDPRVRDTKPEMVEKSIAPEVDLGAHTASLGLAFYDANAFPEKYRGGAFVAQHGSWNRKELSGYKVVFVPFKDGKPSGKPEDFLTGFIVEKEKDKVYGRPTGIIVAPDGSLLLTDDKTHTIWRISSAK